MIDRPMNVLDHLNELKRRLFRFAVLAVIFAGVTIWKHELIFNTYTRVPRQYVVDAGGQIQQLTPFDAWVSSIKLAIYVALAVALPYLLFEISQFLRPALKSGERKYVYLLIPAGLTMFALGAAGAHFFLIPRLFEFMLDLQSGLAVPNLTPKSIVDITVRITFWIGLIFELPIIMFLLAKIGILTSAWLKTKRRWMILIAFIIGAIVTPTDPLSQVMVAVPVMLLFEIGMLLVRLAERGQTE